MKGEIKIARNKKAFEGAVGTGCLSISPGKGWRSEKENRDGISIVDYERGGGR